MFWYRLCLLCPNLLQYSQCIMHEILFSQLRMFINVFRRVTKSCQTLHWKCILNVLTNKITVTGEVTTLIGLNIGGNPLKFPTQEIIRQGVFEILKYLRLLLLSKSNGSFRPNQLNGSNNNGEAETESHSDDEPFASQPSKFRFVHLRP